MEYAIDILKDELNELCQMQYSPKLRIDEITFKQRRIDLERALSELQHPLFKVATEDSPEVLVEPEFTAFYKRGWDVGFQEESYNKAKEAYNKAPLISEDRLELNKMRVEHATLSSNHDTSKKRLMDLGIKLTEANKQLKEHKEVVKNVKKLIDYDEYSHEEILVQITELLSKLNKD